MTIYKVKVNYISGNSESFWCKEFEVDKYGDLKWVTYSDKKHPIRPIAITIKSGQIESIWQTETKEIKDATT